MQRSWKKPKGNKQKKRREEQQAKRESDKNWRPSAGDTVIWKTASEEVVIEKVEGDTAFFHFADDPDEKDTAAVEELARKT